MHFLHRIFIAIFATATFWSCDRVTDNGPIDGFWQLTQIVTNDNEKTTIYNAKEDNTRLAFQLELSQLSLATGVFSSTFSIKNNQLILSKLYRSAFATDSLLTDSDLANLAFYGIISESPVFDIVTLNKASLILRLNNKELHFRRY